jgi:hypothetical protein
LNSFKNALKLPEDEAGDMIEKLFGIELVNTVRNKETDAEPE